MKAAVLHRFGDDLKIEDITVAPPGPHDVLVDVVASGVCHSDLTVQHGGNPALGVPVVLGHEVAGIVAAVGSAITHLAPGDHVVACAAASCGSCRWCQTGQLQHCVAKPSVRQAGSDPRLSLAGRSVGAFVELGGFAEQMLVHESTLAKIPAAMPLDKAALLGCAGVTGLGAVRNTAQVRVGDSVAVIGCGGIGLFAIQGARIAGASQVIAVDRMPEKLQAARELGATHTVDASAVDPVEAVREISGNGVTHVLEAVGIASTIEQAFSMLDSAGTATVIGMARADTMVTIPAQQLLLERRLQGSRLGGTRFQLDIPFYCDLYLTGRLDLDALVTRTIGLDDLNDALGELRNPVGARTVISFA